MKEIVIDNVKEFLEINNLTDIKIYDCFI